jgi:DNA uptake protein ComE-like DNA-binding protein
MMQSIISDPLPSGTRAESGRPGYVLIAVLVVIVVLSLVAYRFTDAMTSDYRASVRSADMAQARAAAASGVNYVAALLADPTTRAEVLGNSLNNPSRFQSIPVRTDPSKPKKDAFFSIVAFDTFGGSAGPRYGITDEGGKLNINALIKIDPTGEALYNALLQLPNMTADIADAIVDWVDADDNVRPAGAESADYADLGYRAKNGPLNSLDELLLVRGVTPQLLFGTDRNRNGIDDDGGRGGDRGWYDFLTVHGREVNVDSTGTLRIWINHNSDDLPAIYKALQESGLDEEMAAYLIAAKIYTRTQLDAQGNPLQMGKGGKKGGKNQKIRIGGPDDLISAVEASLKDATTLAPKTVSSLMDLINTRVTLPGTGGTGAFGVGETETVVINCPLNDATRRNEILPVLLDKVCTKEAVELLPRLNVNTAEREVLLGLPGLEESDVDAIIAAREGLVPDDPATTSGAWLLTSAGLTPAKFKALEKYATGTSMIYRMEAHGYLAGGSPLVRVEAVIDINLGSPRILYYRELTDLDQPRAFQPPQQ